jgi:predicted metal-dependent enzyme (double-stranded beta helix superfamily)
LHNIGRLRDFVATLTRFADAGSRDEAAWLEVGKDSLRTLIAHDDWLPAEFALPDPLRYRQFLLHCDPLERFSIVSFVWGAGQSTPIHDHTVWGLIGVLRGAEIGTRYEAGTGALRELGTERLETGEVEAVSPTIGDIHRVSNAYQDRPSISIHVYGANIGGVRRSSYLPDGGSREFISGYSSAVVPNLWDRSQ